MSFLNKLKSGIKIEISREDPKKSSKKGRQKPAEEKEIQDEQWLETEGELMIDVYQENNKVVIQAPVAGIKVEDLDIEIENDTIKIQGERKQTHKINQKDYFLQECYWGSFSKEIILPFEVNGAKADAIIKQGILIIKIPKKRSRKSTKLKIKKLQD